MDERIKVYDEKMTKTFNNLLSEFGSIRAGRANPHVLDGKVIRLVFPELTEERRKDLAKEVKKKGEAAKVAVRNIRRDANDAFKKLKGSDVSEDTIKELEEQTQKLTDKYIKEVDKAIEEKSKEIMTV